jgi:cysteine desulfurase/selenocysteine lyase
MLDSKKIREDFPVFDHHPDLVYLDSAATALKPRCVIEKEREYMEEYPMNISRGLYPIAEKATEEYEKTRDTVAKWIGASRDEIIFTKGTTESINLLSYALEKNISREENVVVTAMDHHANFLPWQALAKSTGAKFRVVPVSMEGEIDRNALSSLVNARTKIFAFPYISNVLGTIFPVREITEKVRALAPNAIIILDAAQAVAHMTLDTKKFNVDFLAFSAHKCFGPTGVGILWGKYALLEALPPFQYGGDMVESAQIKGSIFKKPPHRFEAGTPNISGVIAFRAAIEYMQAIGMEHICKHEAYLTKYALKKLREYFPDISILGSDEAEKCGNLISFTLPGIHPHDLAEVLGQENICLRAGTHCAHPLHSALGIPATARMSFSIYSSTEDIDRAIEGIKKAKRTYRHPREVGELGSIRQQ